MADADAVKVPKWRAVASTGNLLAGISVGAYLIPQAMAYASLAGVDASTGLTIAAVPILVYMLLGRSRFMSVGPESTVALMSAAAVGPVMLRHPEMPVTTGLAITAMLVGAILLVGWLLKAAFLADLLSNPILVGYMTGVAILMITSQIGKVFNYDVDGSTPFTLLKTEWQVPDWRTVLLAALVLGCALLFMKINKRIPGTLIGLALATLIAVGMDVPKVGPLELRLPIPSFSGLSPNIIIDLLAPALSIAIVAFTDVMVTSRAFAGGVRPQASSEMSSLAVSQMVTGAAGGYPMSASTSRTALAMTAGATTRFYAIFVVLVLLMGPLLLPMVIAEVPMAALSGVIIYAAVTLVNPSEWLALFRFRKTEMAIAMACAVSVIFFGILPGVLIAVAVSIIDFIARLSRPHEGVLGFVPDYAGMHDVDDHARAETIPGLVVFRYDAPLFFMNGYDFYDKVMEALEPDTKVVLLNMEANVELDTTALNILQEMNSDLAEKGIDIWMARVKEDVRAPLLAHGVGRRVGEENMYPTLPTAVAAYRAQYLSDTPEAPQSPEKR